MVYDWNLVSGLLLEVAAGRRQSEGCVRQGVGAKGEVKAGSLSRVRPPAEDGPVKISDQPQQLTPCILET